MGRASNGWILGLAAAGVVLAVRERIRRSREIELSGKVALITGGSRGLGLELARQLARAGAKIGLSARSLDELERANAELTELGAEVFILPADITNAREAEQIVHSVQERLGPIDILINCAGTIQVGPLEEMTVEDFEDAMNLHFWAALHMMNAVIPGMRANGGGRIVNISSIGGKVAVPHLAPYSASKFALVGLSEALRAELAPSKICVTTVCPGLMRTGSHVNAQFKGQNEKEYAWFSIGNASPLLSVSAGQAAEEILRACRFGDAELVFPLSAKAAALIHGILPGFTSDLMGLASRMMPGAGGIGQGHAAGKDSRSWLAPPILTRRSDAAAEANNELSAG